MRPHFSLPLEPQRFLTEYWQKKPLLMPASSSGLAHPDPDTLAGLALEEGIESRIISGHGDGPWNSQQGPFAPEDFASLPRSNWTLLVQSVDHFLTEVSLLLDDFRFLPAWRLEDIMISYASRGGSVGPHYDRYDVFLLQARGQRRWQVGPVCDERTPLLPHDSLRLLQDMPVEAEHVCSPGDVLYLPPGVAHWGTALDDDCVTWSVGFRAPAPVDILERLVDAVAEQDEQHGLFRDPNRTAPAMSSALQQEDLADLTGQALQAIGEDERRTALCTLLSEPRQPAGLDFEVDCGHIAAAEPGAVLVRHGAARMIMDDLGDVWINGQCWPMDEDTRPLARTLAETRIYQAQDLARYDSPEQLALLDEWVDEGYFTWLEKEPT